MIKLYLLFATVSVAQCGTWEPEEWYYIQLGVAIPIAQPTGQTCSEWNGDCHSCVMIGNCDYSETTQKCNGMTFEGLTIASYKDFFEKASVCKDSLKICRNDHSVKHDS